MKSIALSGFVLSALVLSAPVQAADSPCKGLDNAVCTKTAGCGWVNSFKRKDGRQVKAFCRKKSAPPKPKPKA